MTYFGLLNGSVLIGGAIEYAVKTKVIKTLYEIKVFGEGGGLRYLWTERDVRCATTTVIDRTRNVYKLIMFVAKTVIYGIMEKVFL